MGDDIIVLEPGEDGAIVNSNDAISSFDGLNDPLDLTEDNSNGNIYVAEFAGRKIVLLRPIHSGITGDFNDDGEVNAADYITWRSNLGLPVSLPNETSTMGMVTQEDYNTWRSNFGAISAAAEPKVSDSSMNSEASTIPTESVAASALYILSTDTAAERLQRFRMAPIFTASATNTLPVEVAVVDDVFGDFNTRPDTLSRTPHIQSAAFVPRKNHLLLAPVVATPEGDDEMLAPQRGLPTYDGDDEPIDVALEVHDGVGDILNAI